MRRQFTNRSELASYLAEQFLEAAERESALSPIRGGAKAAGQALNVIKPAPYKFNRNFLDGNVSQLSPYIRHGLLSLHQVRNVALARVKDRYHAAKFVTELAWRDYWQRLYAELGSGVWDDREGYKTGLPAAGYATDLPADIGSGQTGLVCMDSFVAELRTTGYLHNHARMWFAAYVVHFRRVSWQAGARFFLSHLLDGDPASNNLSWQWVASTFSHKPYFFNRENLEKYSGGRYCDQCPLKGRCDFEGSYEELEAKLFR